MSEDLDSIREQIDGIDSELLRLLNRRMELAARVGRIKASGGLLISHPEREQIVFKRLLNLNGKGPLTEESLRSIYREVFAASRLVQCRLVESGFVQPRLDAAFPAARRADKLAVCGCLDECRPQEFPALLNHFEADMVEWRMDKFYAGCSSEEMKSLMGALSVRPRLPVIATNRPVRETGAFNGPEDLRLSMLEEAAKSGAEWIDLEHDSDLDHIPRFRRAGAKVLISWHCSTGTPSSDILRAKLESMQETGADALKIVTLAQSSEDNLRVLELIPLAGKQSGIGLIAFCMGQAGKWSRPASLLLGSPWTYAKFEGRSETAPGQLSICETGALVRMLGQH